MFCGKFFEACSVAKSRLVFGGFAAFSIASIQPLCATEIPASRADTFIAEAIADSELSKSNFLAVSSRRGERAIAYIPFEFDAPAVGLVAGRDEIISSKLTLFVKKIPDLPKSENPQSAGGAAAVAVSDSAENPESVSSEISRKTSQATDRAAAEKSGRGMAGDLGGASDSADSAMSDTSDKAEAVKRGEKSDSKIRIEVFAVVDEDVFEPNTKNFRVSWSGKNAAIAPKHNGVDDKLDTVGLYKLGEIVLDLQNEKYDDGDRVEFSSDELTEYLSFAYGINTARTKSPKFRTPLAKQRYGALVLRQISGACEVYFHSADSFGADSARPENGDVVEREVDAQDGGGDAREKPAAENSDGSARAGDASEVGAGARNFASAQDSSVSDVGKSALKSDRLKFVKASEWASKTAPSLSENAAENVSADSENPTAAVDAAGVAATAAENGISSEKASATETPEEEEDADVRPRIDFEFRMTNAEAADSENSDGGLSDG